MLPLTYKSSGTLTVRHTRSAVATVDDHTTMKFLVIVFLAAAACASPTEKREAEPSEVVYPYVSYESSNYYRNKRSAEPEASDVYYSPYDSYGQSYYYRQKRSAEPEASDVYYNPYDSYGQSYYYRNKRSAEPKASDVYYNPYDSYGQSYYYRNKRSAEPCYSYGHC
ncbi:uncharacterized protein [Panulirus ornatus]|uniref:uncharacterized protein n=1 Tax=Panulirus ornatus TaxID=150431 RepID=UPI003A83F0B6